MCTERKFSFDAVVQTFLGAEQVSRIEKTTIGIAGCGGLGSNCAMLLARSGFRHFEIADFDVVEPSNLNRQAFFPYHLGSKKVNCLKEILLMINPDAQIGTHDEFLEKQNCTSIFSGCDVIVEAFDKADCKAMIVETFLNTSKLIVSASGLGGYGDSNAIVTRKIRENFYLVGDGVSGVGEHCKPFAPRVMCAAAKQADAVLEWVLSGS